MALKKTTKVLYCQLPKGTSSTTFKRKSGNIIKDIDIMDIYEDVVAEPYLPYILQALGMLNTVSIVDEDDQPMEIYTVPCKNYDSYDAYTIMDTVRREVKTHDPALIGELVTTIMGIQYILHAKTRFEIDVVMIVGNTVEDIREEKISQGEHVTVKRKRGTLSDKKDGTTA